EKANDELELAQHCIEVNKFSKSLNCSYYAIFHSARALLAIEKLDFKKHSGVISFFIKTYINKSLREFSSISFPNRKDALHTYL
ncbi:MAG: HEPN domain-containing protein, partial [Candidatus Omnitrophica bacterium]|nr:HEPN domain-containing protein [Candidatus Omnitrophota bacterium]